jgi:hypothetical protein
VNLFEGNKNITAPNSHSNTMFGVCSKFMSNNTQNNSNQESQQQQQQFNPS